MFMLSHKQKKRLARSMLSTKERLAKIPMFLSNNWNIRREQREEKMLNRAEKIRLRREAKYAKR